MLQQQTLPMLSQPMPTSKKASNLTHTFLSVERIFGAFYQHIGAISRYHFHLVLALRQRTYLVSHAVLLRRRSFFFLYAHKNLDHQAHQLLA